jgi:hypothetical protein
LCLISTLAYQRLRSAEVRTSPLPLSSCRNIAGHLSVLSPKEN